MRIVGSYLRAVFSGALVAPAGKPLSKAIERLNAITDQMQTSNQQSLAEIMDATLHDIKQRPRS